MNESCARTVGKAKTSSCGSVGRMVYELMIKELVVPIPAAGVGPKQNAVMGPRYVCMIDKTPGQLYRHFNGI